VGTEDLGDIIQQFVATDYFTTNTYIRSKSDWRKFLNQSIIGSFRHVEIVECGNLDLTLNLR